MEIGDRARGAAGPGWSQLTVRRAQVGAHALTTVIRDGREIAAEGVDEPFQRLRELSYREGAGTWFTCELTFSAGTRGYTGRVDAAAPPFEDVPAAAALAELTIFPREEPPRWLLAASPTAAPIGLPVTYGPDRWPDPWPDPWPDHRGIDRPPRAQINGELAYAPAAAMTARAFDDNRENGRHLVYLGAEPEHLVVTSYRDAYWVTRPAHGTREGVRSITLDGAALRLELTPAAADALQTETAFEVHLDLPPERIARLRVALPELLRHVARPPDLIGF